MNSGPENSKKRKPDVPSVLRWPFQPRTKASPCGRRLAALEGDDLVSDDPGLSHRLSFSYHVVDAMIQFSFAADSKIRTLIAMNSVVLAAGFVLLERGSPTTPELVALVGSVLASITSLGVGTWFLRPQFTDSRFKSTTVRTVMGITTSGSTEGHQERMLNVGTTELLNAQHDYIWQMTEILHKKRRRATVAIAFTLISLSGVAVFILLETARALA